MIYTNIFHSIRSFVYYIDALNVCLYHIYWFSLCCKLNQIKFHHLRGLSIAICYIELAHFRCASWSTLHYNGRSQWKAIRAHLEIVKNGGFSWKLTHFLPFHISHLKSRKHEWMRFHVEINSLWLDPHPFPGILNHINTSVESFLRLNCSCVKLKFSTYNICRTIWLTFFSNSCEKVSIVWNNWVAESWSTYNCQLHINWFFFQILLQDTWNGIRIE